MSLHHQGKEARDQKEVRPKDDRRREATISTTAAGNEHTQIMVDEAEGKLWKLLKRLFMSAGPWLNVTKRVPREQT